jgi:hypothetical protein
MAAAVGSLMIRRTFDRDDSVVDRCSEVRFGGFLHLKENHGRNFFRRLKDEISLKYERKVMSDTYKSFVLATVSNADVGLARLAEYLEWEMFDIRLYLCIIEFASDELFCIENTTE